MTGATLISPKRAAELLTALFEQSDVCTIAVSEETAFADSAYLELGEVKLFPATDSHADVAKAIAGGAFEWSTVGAAAATTDLARLLGIDKLTGDPKVRADDKLSAFVDSLGGVSYRLGLAHPHFDPRTLQSMPFRRPTTIVSDTSGVLQGGLSFVARYLHPAARIKVPAVVQMEIVNFSDRFLSNRRSSKPKPADLLIDHVKSQAGQRVLIHLELHSDVELERTFLLGDPLRGAFQREEDKELKELNISVPLRAYADRLILEAARQHQSQVSFGHPVMLLTSDQGLARMAIAEGVTPLYFRAAKAGAFFGRRLTGANFHPFTGQLCRVGLAEVLWDLATAFGCARLISKDNQHGVVVRAIGKELSWAPYHSEDDLLWIETIGSQKERGSPAARPSPRERPSTRAATAALGQGRRLVKTSETPRYKFSVEGFLALVDKLDNEETVSVDVVRRTVGVKTDAALVDYRRFLESGEAIVVEPDRWVAKPATRALAVAIRNLDVPALRDALRAFPSYVWLQQRLAEQPVGKPVDASVFGRAASTYSTLAEITELGASIYGDGFYATPRRPTDEAFATVAINTSARLEEAGGWVSTGRWLEEMIKSEGIHPLVARGMLQSASERRLLRRVTEGSTTETKYDRHVVRSIAMKDGKPTLRNDYLYRGDFLIPGKASSSLRIEKATNEPT